MTFFSLKSMFVKKAAQGSFVVKFLQWLGTQKAERKLSQHPIIPCFCFAVATEMFLTILPDKMTLCEFL